jgi:hypothetical protein
VLSSEVVDCQCSCEIFELSELIVAIVLGIFNVHFLEGLEAFFYFGDLFEDLGLAVDFLGLLRLKVILTL